jgi:hypothetical protein
LRLGPGGSLTQSEYWNPSGVSGTHTLALVLVRRVPVALPEEVPECDSAAR